LSGTRRAFGRQVDRSAILSRYACAMQVTRVNADRRCGVCERTLLMGERTMRFSPDGGREYVDVCPLCRETALEYGWLKEGAPVSATMPVDRRRGRLSLGSLLGTRRPTEVSVASEPLLQRLTPDEHAIVEAADLFNASQFRRTIASIGKSLGAPSVAVTRLSGINGEIVITVAWEISWYQYRVTPELGQPVRLAERGHEIAELDGMFTDWNARITEDGRVVPDVAVD
jgi:hypothetical protein